MKKFNLRILLVLIFILPASSCYKEFVISPGTGNRIFNFIMTEEAESRILEARREKFIIEPTPVLYYSDIQFQLDKMKLRGVNTLNFQRKSYSINLDKSIVFEDRNSEIFEIEKFKLISMVYDYTYIENRLAHILMNKIGIWPLYSFYAEVKLNSNHQGLYLFIEDPPSYVFNEFGAEVILRRDYRTKVSSIEVFDSLSSQSEDYYIGEFKSIYEIIKESSGEQLYQNLSQLMNLQNYMRKMAIDLILQNGDCTDEVFFYAVNNDGELYFDILPWDYDDLFNGVPHEVNRAWGVGITFGTRIYDSHDDVLETLGGKLVFTIEDDLDYIIAMDDFLYQKYLVELDYVLSKISENEIEKTFQQINDEILPFYNKDEIIEQSKFDVEQTSLEKYEKNFVSKKAFLINQIRWITNERTFQ